MAWEHVDRVGRRLLRGLGARSLTEGELHSYVIERQGPVPLALLHGIGASGLSWGLVLHQLRAHPGPIWMPDLPGHGFSAPPPRLDIPTVLQGLEAGMARAFERVGPMVVVGHSLGAVMAVRLANRHPGWVRGLLLVTPAGATHSEEGLQAVKAALSVQGRKDAQGHRRSQGRALQVKLHPQQKEEHQQRAGDDAAIEDHRPWRDIVVAQPGHRPVIERVRIPAVEVIAP